MDAVVEESRAEFAVSRAWPLRVVALAAVGHVLHRFPHGLMRLHLHLLSDSTGETLENIAKAALAHAS